MDAKQTRSLMMWLSFSPFLFTACSHAPSKTSGTDQSLSLPIIQQVKEAPAPKVAPDQWDVHSTEEQTRSDAKLSNNAGSKAAPVPKKNGKQKQATKLPPKAPRATPQTGGALVFDVPVAYNPRVRYWVEYFQTTGRGWFTKWLERSPRYLPLLQTTLARHGLPKDLAYLAMIESGFSPHAASAAKAVGPWQFVRETGQRYGLKVLWWLDERRDLQKSTDAAAKYMKRMYGMFHNWYLVAAGYNTGENRIKRQIEQYGTKNFWKLAHLEDETRDYVPKFIAALLIAKSPALYGFHDIKYEQTVQFEHFRAPGGTRLNELALAIGVTPKVMRDLNPELVREYIPNYISGYYIRIPKGSAQLVSLYFRRTFVSER